jgi:hypothetical protein
MTEKVKQYITCTEYFGRLQPMGWSKDKAEAERLARLHNQKVYELVETQETEEVESGND